MAEKSGWICGKSAVQGIRSTDQSLCHSFAILLLRIIFLF